MRSAVAAVERKRIARDVHDIVGQALVYVRLNLEAARLQSAEPESLRRLNESVDAVDRAIAAVRAFALDLHPIPLEIGLVEALRAALFRRAEAAGYEPDVIVDTPIHGADPATEAACFRIVDEALTNIDRHARAGHVELRVAAADGQLLVTVSDDGQGFEVPAPDAPASRSLGLFGMAERAAAVGGVVTVTSAPGRGTTIAVRLPIAA